METKSGGSVLAGAFFKCLQNIFGVSNIDYMEITPKKKSRWKWLKGVANKNILSFDKKSEKDVLQRIKSENYSVVIIGTSNIGELAGKIKKQCPMCRVGILFHNVEYHYFKELARIEGKQKIPLAYLAYYNEKNALKYGDYWFVLNSRDIDLLRKVYGFSGDVTELSIGLKDKFIRNKIVNNNSEKIEAIFVGIDFFPNREGMDWFVENVMPYVDINLKIIGKGMEKYRNRWGRNNVKVLGTVEDLSDYYYNADLVVEPIFSGGGMKTKTAEALMYGKIVFGTKEAFEGYEMNYGQNAELCMTAQDFIEAINKWKREDKFQKFNVISRDIFERNYSIEQMINRIRKAFM